jgi:hypothetical protein
MNKRLIPTTQLRWKDKEFYTDSFDIQARFITILEQWHQNEVLTETHGWQPVEGGEWKEVNKEKNEAQTRRID